MRVLFYPVAYLGGVATVCVGMAFWGERINPAPAGPAFDVEMTPYVRGVVADNVQLRWQGYRDRGRIADLEAELARALGRERRCVDGADPAPAPAAEVPAGGRIAPQALPVTPGVPPVAIPTPRELGIDPEGLK
jgi:hypothetical protein